MLETLPIDKVIDGIISWLKRVSEDGTGAGWLTIFECVPDNGLDIFQHELDRMSAVPDDSELGI